MDLNKKEIFKEEKKLKEEIKEKYLENSYLLNLKKINDYMFHSNVMLMLIFGKKIYEIEGVNFTMYFLAKSFIYLRDLKDLFSQELKNLLEDNIKLISKNLYDLWIKNIDFYGHKICSKFLLYRETKQLFESKVILSGNDFKIYEEFFTKDIHFKANGQDNKVFCYASRLSDRDDDSFKNNKKIEKN